MFYTKLLVAEIKTHIFTFSDCGEDRQAMDDNIIRRMRCACWTTTATNTPLEYVVLTALPGQQWFCERTSMLYLHMYTLPLLFSSSCIHC